MTNNTPNGLIISAMDSGCGKTTITAMLLAAINRRKLLLQPYKIGFDVNDCGLHCRYSNEISLNLDMWIMDRKNILSIINRLAEGYFGLIEGLGGIFQHHYPNTPLGGDLCSSTMELAQLVKWPVLLIICCEDCHEVDEEYFSQVVSIVNTVNDEDVSQDQTIPCVAGVILNKVDNQGFAQELTHFLSQHHINVFGCVEKSHYLEHPTEMYHPNSIEDFDHVSKEKLAEIAECYLKIDEILTLCEPVSIATVQTDVIYTDTKKLLEQAKTNNEDKLVVTKKRIAISNDEAFSFYYNDNHQFLQDCHVEIVTFSVLHDRKLPDNLDGLILSGGIPEKYAQEITQNHHLLDDIKNKIDSGLPCYAECGGLMLLSEGIYLPDKQFFPMLGCVPGKVIVTEQLQYNGYAICQTSIKGKNLSLRGNEFHYARWLEEQQFANLWQTTTCSSGETRQEGYASKNIHASFVHLYFPSSAEYIRHFFNFND